MRREKLGTIGNAGPNCPYREWGAVLLLARRDANSGDECRLQPVPSQPLDWERMYGIAEWNGIVPALHRNLARFPRPGIPADFLLRIKGRAEEIAKQNLQLTAELLRVVALLEANSIRALPYKGPALAILLQGNVGQRQFSDLDILVPMKDVMRANDVLLAAGFQPERPFDAEQQSRLLRSDCEYSFIGKDGTRVELHWQALPRVYGLGFDFEELWQRSESISIGQNVVRTLSREDLLLVLCAHAAKHLWGRSSLSEDIAGVLEVSPGMNWPEVLRRATQQGSRRILLLSLHLAKDLAGARLPPDLVNEISREGSVTTLGRRVKRNLFLKIDPEEAGRELSHRWVILRARERWRDKALYAFRLAFCPSLADVGFAAGRLVALAVFVRVARLALRSARSLHSAAAAGPSRFAGPRPKGR